MLNPDDRLIIDTRLIWSIPPVLPHPLPPFVLVDCSKLLQRAMDNLRRMDRGA
jgi:hypothetical protein